ncbi:OmpW family outer membrane protein [Rhodoblastus sp. 17X3]|uniref:OmpW/AlkL family protein n=1 Tax=Rhodoblastus sp. 17X3 TaxID=3047026 RepID=UPI0024B827CB|nr:OmpW family outer membrane protein [Rhodoblastus sp. 17X3]MDI9848380.1 OmpW family outer membrane protein [Rhodoblastus sp. 17X3]
MIEAWTRKARRRGAALGAMMAATTAQAADLPSYKEAPPAPVVDSFQPFFVKVGFTYALNSSSSRLWGQDPAAMRRGNFTAFPAHVGATIGDIATAGFEAGVYVTHNISVNISGGIPYYVNDKTKGFNPANPILTNGTVLAQIVPALIPITVLYHFDNFGPIRPYLGTGVGIGFSLGNKNAFLNDVHVSSSLGWVLQGGADYMIDRNWGLSLDVKKTFAYVEAYANGINVAGMTLPAKVYQHTNFQPWLFSLGIVYRFGGGEPILAKY